MTAKHRGRGVARIIWRRTKSAVARAALGLAERCTSRRYIGLEYPPNAENVARYGGAVPQHLRLTELLATFDQRYADALQEIIRYCDDLIKIPVRERESTSAYWINSFLPALDGAAIYAFLRSRNARRYIEIGSGHSTKFAAQAKQDGALHTEVTSIDPYPRAEVDSLCDRLIRSHLEEIDLELFSELEQGDVVFMDGSHVTFMNNDVVTFFLDVLPGMPAGVLVGIHDIFLPYDYPPEMADRWYSEQYMLAAYLLGNPPIEVMFPATYVTRHPTLRFSVDALWDHKHFDDVGERHGAAFWFTTR